MNQSGLYTVGGVVETKRVLLYTRHGNMAKIREELRHKKHTTAVHKVQKNHRNMHVIKGDKL